MREVTIKRHKVFTGCLAKVKVYIEDEQAAELEICGIPCRKLGELKNGEEKTFSVTEDAVRIFVIGDKISKNFCVECYPLEAGQDAVCLSGKNKFNLINGNAFRFDNNESEEARQYRKKGSKKGIAIMCVAALVGFVIGFVGNLDLFQPPASPKTFQCDDMCITLTDAFEETAYEGLRTGYESRHVVALVLKEEFSLAEGFESLSVEQYGELVRDNLIASSFEPSALTVHDRYVSMQYHASGEDELICTAFAYKGQDAFWVVRFLTLADEHETYSSQVEEWASSVRFGA